MWNYNSIPEYQAHLKTMTKELKNMVGTTLKKMGIYAQEKIREKHWVQQPWWPTGTNPTPLRKTGGLANDVTNRINLRWGYVEVWHMSWWLMTKIAKIHENGATFKMTDKQRKRLFANVFKNLPKVDKWKWDGMIRIPARPIRRVVWKDENINNWLKKILEEWLKKVFSS